MQSTSRPEASTLSWVPTRPKLPPTAEYIWHIAQSESVFILKDTKAAIESPSFYCYVNDIQFEWRVQLSQGTQINSLRGPDCYSDKFHMNALLKLVSMTSQKPGEKPLFDVGVQYAFQLRFQNWQACRLQAVGTTKWFAPGFVFGTDSLCTTQHFSDYGFRNGSALPIQLHCKVWMKKETFADKMKMKTASDVLGEYVATRQLPSLTNFMKSMLNDSITADITIKVGTETYHAHKNILSARSKVFADMFGCGKEAARDLKVEITDFEPEIVQAMLKYIYCGDITAAKERPYDLLKIASKYQLLELKNECERFIVPSLTVSSVPQALMCVYEHNLKTSWPNIKDFIIRNQVAISETNGLKTVVERYPTVLFDLYFPD